MWLSVFQFQTFIAVFYNLNLYPIWELRTHKYESAGLPPEGPPDDAAPSVRLYLKDSTRQGGTTLEQRQ